MSWQIFIPKYRPISLNEYHRFLHRKKKFLNELVGLLSHYNREVPLLRRKAKVTAGGAGVQFVIDKAVAVKRRVYIELIMQKGQRMMDEDNIEKLVYDALQKAELIANDSPMWVERGNVIQRAAEHGEQWGMRVYIEDVD